MSSNTLLSPNWFDRAITAVDVEVMPSAKAAIRAPIPIKLIIAKVGEYLIHCERVGITQLVIRTKSLEMARFVTWCGNRAVDSNLIDSYLIHIMGRISSASADRVKKSHLSPFFTYMVQEGYIPFNPIQFVRVKTSPGQPRTDTLTEEEYHQLIEANQGREIAVAFQIQWNTGMRLDDAVMLKWSNVDWERQMIRFIPGKTKKLGTVVEVPLVSGSDLMETLVSLRPKPGDDQEYILPKMAEAQLRYVEDMKVETSRNAFLRAGIKDKRSHSLRRAFITRAIARGVNSMMVMRLVGIKDPSVLNRYLHPTPDDLRAAMMKVHQPLEPERIAVCS